MSKQFLENLLSINCAYNFKEEARDKTTTLHKCYSTTCMLNQDKEVSKYIQQKGCVIYKKDFVKSVIDRKVKT